MERVKGTITWVGEVLNGEGKKGPWEKLSFKFKNGDGKDLPHFTFSKALFQSIRDNVNKEVEIDREVTSREANDGNTYTDRKVTQVYVDGQAVGQKGQGRGGWQKSDGDSPEKRLSIESQVAFTGILTAIMQPGFLPSHPLYTPMSELAGAAMAWGMARLGSHSTAAVPIVGEANKPPTSPPSPLVEAAKEAGAVEGKQELPVMTTSKEFYDACKLQLGLKVTDTSKLISQSQEINEAFNSKDFTTAFRLAKETAGK